MTERLVNKLVNQMIQSGNVDAYMKEEYIYALEVLIEKIITICSLLVVSICLENSVESLIFMIFLFSLRKRTGGFHAKTFGGCYITSMVVFMLSIPICSVIESHMWITDVLCIVCAIIIFIIGAVNHPNLDLNEKELKELKKAARMIIVIEMGMIVCCHEIKLSNNVIAYMEYAIYTCAFSIILSKIIYKGRRNRAIKSIIMIATEKIARKQVEKNQKRWPGCIGIFHQPKRPKGLRRVE